jgi:hypothetical protein
LERQETQGEKRKARMVVPTDPAAGFVLVESAFAFPGLKVLFHAPSALADFSELFQGNAMWCIVGLTP